MKTITIKKRNIIIPILSLISAFLIMLILNHFGEIQCNETPNEALSNKIFLSNQSGSLDPVIAGSIDFDVKSVTYIPIIGNKSTIDVSELMLNLIDFKYDSSKPTWNYYERFKVYLSSIFSNITILLILTTLIYVIYLLIVNFKIKLM